MASPKKITGQLTDAAGNGASGQVIARLSQVAFVNNGEVAPSLVVVQTDSSGNYNFDPATNNGLYSNADMTPANTFYTITPHRGGQPFLPFLISVPNSAGPFVMNNLVIPVPGLPSTGLGIASLIGLAAGQVPYGTSGAPTTFDLAGAMTELEADLGEKLAPQGAWSSVTAYSVNDMTSYSGITYYSIQPGTNHQPDLSPTYWTPIIGTAATILTANATIGANRFYLADATGIDTPRRITATAVGSGGTLAGTYYWSVTAIGPLGESIAPIGAAVVTGATDSVTLNWLAPVGTASVTGYKVYRSAFAFGNVAATNLQLVATLGNVLTYTDTGIATSASAPPATNGGAFTLTLPTAVGYTEMLQIGATGKTNNLVTLAPVSAQTIDGAASMALGVAPTADKRVVSLVSDGANWRTLQSVDNAPRIVVAANPYVTACPAGVLTAVAMIPSPALIPNVTKMAFAISAQITPGPGTTQIQLSINACDSNGNSKGNIAFLNSKDFGIGDPKVPAGTWNYNPRPGDINLDDGNWPALGGWIALHVFSAGGASTVTSAQITAIVGNVSATYWPHI